MAKRIKGAETGKSYITIMLKKGMPAPFADTELLLVNDVEACVWYEFDRGHQGSMDEPPSPETFECTIIRIKKMASWVDDSGNYYCKTFGKTDILPMFSEATLQELDERVKMLVQKDNDGY